MKERNLARSLTIVALLGVLTTILIPLLEPAGKKQLEEIKTQYLGRPTLISVVYAETDNKKLLDLTFTAAEGNIKHSFNMIYNYRNGFSKLRDWLEDRGFEFKEITDDTLQLKYIGRKPADRAAALKHAEKTVDQPLTPSLATKIASSVYWPETLNDRTLKEDLRKAEEAFEEARVVWQREGTPEAKRKMDEANEAIYRIVRTIPSEAAMESLIKEAIEKAKIALDQARADHEAGKTSEAEVKKAGETLSMLCRALPAEIKQELIIEGTPAYLGEKNWGEVFDPNE